MPAAPSGIAAAVAAARKADLVVLALGEDYDWSGEVRSRSSLELPGRQRDLLTALKAAGKPVVVVLMGGRPLAIPEVAKSADAVLATWLLGLESGNAITCVLFGDVNPAGRLPVTFPRTVGQVPCTCDRLPSGRPADPDPARDTARYLDLAITPLYAFGHGLSYTRFTYGAMELDKAQVAASGGAGSVSVSVTNSGTRAGDEVVQLCMRDPVASVSRPVKQLRGYARVHLQPGATKRVTFALDPAQFALWSLADAWLIEAGRIELMAGAASDDIRARGELTIIGSAPRTIAPAAIPTRISVQ
jgi:beta-glucosidase